MITRRELEFELQKIMRLNRGLKKNYNMSSLNNDKKKALEKLTQDHPDVSNVLFYHKFSSCHGLSALFL